MPLKSLNVNLSLPQNAKTNAGRWSRVAATRDLPTIAFFRAGPLLRRSVSVTGILAAHRPGAIMDKSGRQLVVRFGAAQKHAQTIPPEIYQELTQANNPKTCNH